MFKNISFVKNPLTIIGMFAALAEISGTAVLPFITPENQYVFIWFLMLFPPFLVALFFFTIYNKPNCLYAPSDFKNEENYVALVTSKGIDVVKNNDGILFEQDTETENCHQNDSSSVESEHNAPEADHALGRECIHEKKSLVDTNFSKAQRNAIQLERQIIRKISIERKVRYKSGKAAILKTSHGAHEFDGVYYSPENKSLSFIEVKYLRKQQLSQILTFTQRIYHILREAKHGFKDIELILALIIEDGTNKETIKKIADHLSRNLEMIGVKFELITFNSKEFLIPSDD